MDVSTKVKDIEGFHRHCEVAALILTKLPIDPHTKHHISEAIRAASNKVTTIPGDGKESAPFMSKAAGDQMRTGNFLNLRFEHVVPISLINERVLEREDVTPQKIEEIVLKLSVLSVITLHEHEKLKAAGLNQKMPVDWDGEDLFARYRTVGIKWIANEYKQLIKRFRL